MNKFYPEYHEYLKIGKLANSLDPEEEIDFEELMQTDTSFQEGFLAMQQQLTPAELNITRKYANDAEWQDVPAMFKQSAIVRRISWINIAAASVILIVVGAGVLFSLNKKENKLRTSSIPLPAGIELKLADGQKIDLSKSKGSIQTFPGVINNTGEELTYNANGSNTTGINTLTVAPGMDYQVTLEDSSKVWLNSSSRIDFPFAFRGNTREISIQGEAYIQVAKNSAKPFIVHLPQSTVQVLGTEFNINTYDAGVEKISLVNGSVNLKAQNRQIILKPGMQGVSKEDELFQQAFDFKKTLSWRNGLLYFEEAPLTEIVQVIQRWFNVKVIIDNDRNQHKRIVGAVYKTKPLSIFLGDLREVSDIQSYYDKEGILHFK